MRVRKLLKMNIRTLFLTVAIVVAFCSCFSDFAPTPAEEKQGITKVMKVMDEAQHYTKKADEAGVPYMWIGTAVLSLLGANQQRRKKNLAIDNEMDARQRVGEGRVTQKELSDSLEDLVDQLQIVKRFAKGEGPKMAVFDHLKSFLDPKTQNKIRRIKDRRLLNHIE